ncbi:uncharacterized protein [Nothobranchius furzeri]|uniref:uncharacterized protein n=1 Tax=Nothobranchius furzeri TaxID=105023 RepID=UPI003904CA3F
MLSPPLAARSQPLTCTHQASAPTSSHIRQSLLLLEPSCSPGPDLALPEALTTIYIKSSPGALLPACTSPVPVPLI